MVHGIGPLGVPHKKELCWTADPSPCQRQDPSCESCGWVDKSWLPSGELT